MFVCFIIHTFELVFSAGTVFFSHTKSAGTVFRLVFSAKRTGPMLGHGDVAPPHPLISSLSNKQYPLRLSVRLGVSAWTHIHPPHSAVPRPLPPLRARCLPCRALPPTASHPHRRPRRAPSQSPALLAPSPSVRPPSPSHAPLTPPWPLGRTFLGALGLPRPSQGHPRARPMLVVLARRRLPP